MRSTAAARYERVQALGRLDGHFGRRPTCAALQPTDTDASKAMGERASECWIDNTVRQRSLQQQRSLATDAGARTEVETCVMASRRAADASWRHTHCAPTPLRGRSSSFSDTLMASCTHACSGCASGDSSAFRSNPFRQPSERVRASAHTHSPNDQRIDSTCALPQRSSVLASKHLSCWRRSRPETDVCVSCDSDSRREDGATMQALSVRLDERVHHGV